MNIRRTIQRLVEDIGDAHEDLLEKHGFEFAAQDLDPDDPSHIEDKEDHEQESYWEAYHGQHSSGKTHCVWVYPNHKQGLHWVHGEGDPHEEMMHNLSTQLCAAGIAKQITPEPAPMKQHEGFGLPSLAQHLKKHFPIQ